MIKALNTAIKNANSLLKKLLLLILTAAFFYLDVQTDSRVSFALIYYGLVLIAAYYVEGYFPYAMAVIIAMGRAYLQAYMEQASPGALPIAIWNSINYLFIHTLVCYLFLFYIKSINFIKPANNDLLKTEHLHFPKLKELIFRPYINSKWDMKKRVDMIATHYRLVDECVPFFNLTHDASKDIATIESNGMELRVVMDRPKWLRREGELAISLFYGVDRIYSAMILLHGSKGDLKLIIGNIQGDGRDVNELYKQLTKAFHGMRPRDLLFNLIKIIAREIGCKDIWGVSDTAHRSSNFFSKAKKLSGYDSIWLEHGGICDEKSGFFIIPSEIQKRSDEDIPTKKRAMYNRRYQLLDDIQRNMKLKLAI